MDKANKLLLEAEKKKMKTLYVSSMVDIRGPTIRSLFARDLVHPLSMELTESNFIF